MEARAPFHYVPPLYRLAKSRENFFKASWSAKSYASPSAFESESDSTNHHSWRSHYSTSDEPKKPFLVNNRLGAALEYHSYGLSDKSYKYNYYVHKSLTKKAKRIKVNMNTNNFYLFDPISFIGFLSTFKSACDTNGTYEDAGHLFTTFFDWKASRSCSKVLRSAISKVAQTMQAGMFTSCGIVIKYLLKT